ncbi:MAG: methionyl-tRNA formyltransferase [Sulfurovum sp. AS07-7]|nr:MAG: methionyl-tRNA formyltransferase [Sulfurovum sp. AS07-7]
MGTPEYAKIILDGLIKDGSFEISLVVTQPDRPIGRKMELTPPDVKVLALEYDIDILQPKSLKDDGVYEAIVSIKPDFIVVAAFGQLLPRNILDIAPCINLHASLLPLYRGASPVQQCLLNDDKFTGVTAMLMEEGLDSGPVLGYRYFKIPQNMKVNELMDQLSIDASVIAIDVLKNFDNIMPIAQTKAVSSHCKKIKKEDGLIDFESANEIYNKFRAYYGWPGIYLDNKMKLLDIELLDPDSKNKKGILLDIVNDSVIVGCKLGAIKINMLQPESKKAMSAKAYCLGRGLKVGDYLV